MDLRQQQLDIMVSTFHDTLARARHDYVSQAGLVLNRRWQHGPLYLPRPAVTVRLIFFVTSVLEAGLKVYEEGGLGLSL